MADQGASDRNLPASHRKLQRAKADGQIVRSRDLAHFATVGAGGAALVAVAPSMSRWLEHVVADALRFDHATATNPDAMVDRLGGLVGVYMRVALPLGGLMTLIAIAVAVAAGGWVWTMKPMMPSFGKFNPLTGLPRIFSTEQLGQTLKSCLLALIIGTIGAFYLRSHIAEFTQTLSLALPAAVAQASRLMLGGVGLLVLALALFAVVDVPLQRHLHAKRLKMSTQEVKQEHKELEGNAEVKSKLRALMRERAQRRMISAVPQADLVVMNPTHYAVALRYDEHSMGAPRVVAKGADLFAMRIRDVAKENKVPVLQAAVLARALYAHAEVDQEIPAQLFAAVAQVLAYVYQLRAALVGRGKMPADLPELNVPPELDPHNKPKR